MSLHLLGNFDDRHFAQLERFGRSQPSKGQLK